jgi:hypothetical protein
MKLPIWFKRLLPFTTTTTTHLEKFEVLKRTRNGFTTIRISGVDPTDKNPKQTVFFEGDQATFPYWKQMMASPWVREQLDKPFHSRV